MSALSATSLALKLAALKSTCESTLEISCIVRLFLHNSKLLQEARSHSLRGNSINLHSVYVILHTKLSPQTTPDRQHSEEKHFICDQCNYSCNEAGYLKIHMLIHSGEKPFSCNQCKSSFKKSANLKRHISTHSGGKQFLCDQCNYSCKRACNLKIHMRQHFGEKPFVCKQCNFTCIFCKGLIIIIIIIVNGGILSLTDSHHHHHGQIPTMVGICHGGNKPLGPIKP